MLEIELVPSSSFFKNLRSELSKKEWDILRKDSYQQANYVCEVCGGKGPKHPVECHEIWEYKDSIQKLLGLISLCPSCHEVKHIGLAEVKGRRNQAKAHLIKVNSWCDYEAENHIEDAFREWYKRSQVQWELDLSWAHKKLKNDS